MEAAAAAGAGGSAAVAAEAMVAVVVVTVAAEEAMVAVAVVTEAVAVAMVVATAAVAAAVAAIVATEVGRIATPRGVVDRTAAGGARFSSSCRRSHWFLVSEQLSAVLLGFMMQSSSFPPLCLSLLGFDGFMCL